MPAKMIGVIRFGSEPWHWYNGWIPVCGTVCAMKYPSWWNLERRPIKFFDPKGVDMSEFWQKKLDALNRMSIGEVVLDRRRSGFRLLFEQAENESHVQRDAGSIGPTVSIQSAG